MNPKNRCTRDDVIEWVNITLEREGLENYSINVVGNSEVGDGYIGDITFVEASGRKQHQEKSYSFVIKCGKKSKDLRGIMPVRKAFENEIFYYNEILPEFIKLQEEKGIKEPFMTIAKCYDTLIFEEMEVLILENMKRKGYVLHDRKHPMDMEHVEKVIETYGKLHAVSFALKHQKPEIFQKLSRQLVDIWILIYKALKVSENHNGYQQIIEVAKEVNEPEVVEKCNILNEKARTHTDLTDPDDPYAIILHGDCWNNNFLFKYENNHVSDICLLDFQLSRLASPVYDLSYFLFTCLDEEGVENFDRINNLYYETFSSFLRDLGGDPDIIFPYEELMNQWKKFSLFGLAMVPGILKICLSEQEEVVDLAETAESGTEFSEAFKKGVKNTEEYRKRTIPVIKMAARRGFV